MKWKRLYNAHQSGAGHAVVELKVEAETQEEAKKKFDTMPNLASGYFCGEPEPA